jgi:secernin
VGLPDLGPLPLGVYDGKSLWWLHERLHRKILEDYQTRFAIIQGDQRDFESRYLSRLSQVRSDVSRIPANDRVKVLRQITEEAFMEASKLESKWLSRIEELSVDRKPSVLYRRYWDDLSRHAAMR